MKFLICTSSVVFSFPPEPSPGDMFFDLEGDPFIGRGGREYLFGCVADDESGDSVYISQWAVNAEEENRV
jgi:predicted RecB family nuclease